MSETELSVEVLPPVTDLKDGPKEPAPKEAEQARRETRGPAITVTPRDPVAFAPGQGEIVTVSPLPGRVMIPAQDRFDRPTPLPEPIFRSIAANYNFSQIKDHALQTQLMETAATLCQYYPPERVEMLMQNLLNKKVDGKLSVLDKDGEGRTVIENLRLLSQHPAELLASGMTPQLRGELLHSIINDIVSPNLFITQGRRATCTIAVAQSEMAKHAPGEYTRILCGLTTGQVRLFEGIAGSKERRLSDSMVLKFDSGSVYEEGYKGRSLSSRIFQTSADNLVAGYNNGLYNDQVENLYEALYGRAFGRLDADNARFSTIIRRLAESCDGGFNMVSLKWATQGVHTNHAIEVLEVSDGRVTFRNPWGNAFELPSELAKILKVESKEQAIYSIDLREFEKRFNYAMITDKSAVFGLTAGHDDPSDRRGQETTLLVTHPALEQKKKEQKEEEPAIKQKAVKHEMEQPKQVSKEPAGETKPQAQVAKPVEAPKSLTKSIGRRAPKKVVEEDAAWGIQTDWKDIE